MCIHSDTDPRVEQIHIEMLRKAGGAKRASLAISLSETLISLSRRAIARANPDLSEEEQDLLFIAINYGEEMARRVAVYLRQRCI